ncbi:hypothetical protein A3Q56_08671 [Intoshia linei]|uniref:Alphavirus-like MT domain-containing protein n=1 Tax=Intoshia linei TaxID=1819745 RepID=A0A177AQT6_9BILA|nr:hypothetical protein A3Q56_08671 [Intoshia linei]
MVNSDANVAFGCFIFHSDVFLYNRGYIKSLECNFNFKKILIKNRLHIRFWFDDDVQAGYDHDFATYVSLLRTRRLKHRKNNEMYYNLQLDSIRDVI